MTTDQLKAIKHFMAARRRLITTVRRAYPSFIEGMTTANYIREFRRLNNGKPDFQLLDISLQNYETSAPVYAGLDFVLFEEVTT
jgi:hypothetical protein